MHDKDQFFMRDPWVFDPGAEKPKAIDAQRGFDTRSLHSGFDPAQTREPFRSFVPPIIQSMTYPYETFDKIPCPVYGLSLIHI